MRANLQAARVTPRFISVLAPALLLVCAAGWSASAAEPVAIDRTNHLRFSGTNHHVTVSVKTNYYVFGGTNHSQMRAAMIQARPWKRTLSYDAQTKWDLHSTCRFTREGNQFKVGFVEVRTKVVITMPWWIPGKPVPRDLVERWNKCVDGLSRHEQGHLVLAQAATTEVKQRLLNLAPSPSAKELAATAEQTVNETIAEFRERERKYDRATRHGFTQGAIFPRTELEAREGPLQGAGQ